jgi:hypothetical protein
VASDETHKNIEKKQDKVSGSRFNIFSEEKI